MFSKSQEYVDHVIDDLIRRLAEPEPADSNKRADVANELDEEDELDACYAILKSTHNRISTILTRRNDRSLLHRVPEEVLVSILSLSLPSLYDVERSLYYPYLKGLRRVCRLWAQLIDSCPLFWCFITAEMKPGLLKKIIERSGDVPLVFDQLRHLKPVENYMEILKPNLVRCKSLTLSPVPGNDLNLAMEVLESSFPALKRLVLNNNYSGDPTLYPAYSHLVISSFPRLQEVILYNFLGSQPFPWLSNLLFLSLYQANPNLYIVREVLNSCPSLIQFRFGRFDSALGDPQVDEAPGAGDTGERIRLLSLTYLDLFASSEQVGLLLSWIHAPNCHNLSLRLDCMYFFNDKTISSKVVGTAGHFSSFLSRCHIVPSERTLKLAPEVFELNGIGVSIVFAVYAAGTRANRLTNYLPALRGIPTSLRESVTTLEAAFGLKGCNNILQTMMELVPQISTLILPVTWGDRHDGLAELARVVSAGDNPAGPKIWLLPNLNTLHIRQVVNLGPTATRPESYVRVLRKILNVSKTRNQMTIDASGQIVLKARGEGAAALQRLELKTEEPTGAKNKVLLREIRRWTPSVIVEPPKADKRYMPRHPPVNGCSVLSCTIARLPGVPGPPRSKAPRWGHFYTQLKGPLVDSLVE